MQIQGGGLRWEVRAICFFIILFLSGNLHLTNLLMHIGPPTRLCRVPAPAHSETTNLGIY